MKKSILITGGSGFIGSHIANLLCKQDIRCVILDNHQNTDLNNQKSLQANYGEDMVRIHVGSILDFSLLNNIFKTENIKSVIHCAGLKSPNESVSNPISYWETNLSGTINLVKAMQAANVENLVFSSSATVYREKDCVEENTYEEDLVSPVTPYGRTKLYAEQFLLDAVNSRKANNIKVIILRYFNPVGSSHKDNLGENNRDIPANLFPIVGRCLTGKQEYLCVYGNDWNTRDGTAIRDYIHINDLSVGHIKSLEYLEQIDECSEIINLGSGVGYTVFEVINAFEKTSGKKIKVKIAQRREGDVGHSVASNQKAKLLLGWMPQKSLNNMVEDAWKWELIKASNKKQKL